MVLIKQITRYLHAFEAFKDTSKPLLTKGGSHLRCVPDHID